MSQLARRVSCAARLRVSVRHNSTTATAAINSDTRPRPSLAHNQELLQRVASLRAPPALLHDLVHDALHANRWTVPYFRDVLLELCLNSALERRWDDVNLILTVCGKSLETGLRAALEPSVSHGEVLDRIYTHRWTEKGKTSTARFKAILTCMHTRYRAAPFMNGERLIGVLQGQTMYAPSNAPVKVLLEHWLVTLPAHLVRLDTTWERALYTAAEMDMVLENAAKQLRAVEEWVKTRRPEMYESVPIRRGLMLAYSTTRVAPDDSARHWDHLASLPVASLSARTIEHALASAPTLDALNARWSHFETNAESKLTRPGQLSTLQTFYAQHLVRLGARDAAAKFVARYPAHASVAWMFEPGELGNEDEPEEREASTRRNRESVRDLHANGLDFERVLFVLSPNSSFYRSQQKGRYEETDGRRAGHGHALFERVQLS